MQEWSEWSACKEECIKVGCQHNCGRAGKEGISTSFFEKCDAKECQGRRNKVLVLISNFSHVVKGSTYIQDMLRIW